MIKLSEPKNLRKVEYVHMIVDGKFLEQHSRQCYWFEDREKYSMKLLKEGLVGITDDQVMKIIEGNAQLDGSSICDKKDCRQCKGLKQISYTETEDIKFKNEIIKRKLWLNDNCFKIGEFHISKHLIRDYLSELAYYSKMEARDEVSELNEENLAVLRDSLWTVTSHRLPSRDYIPDKGSIDYDFTRVMNDFVNSIERRFREIGFFAEGEIEKVEHEIRSFKEPLESKVELKVQRAEGSVLLIVPDPQDNYKYKRINLSKEHLLNYLSERSRGEQSMKFTLSMDLDKDKVLERYKNLQKQMGQVHTLLMESMNLHHIDSGIYPRNCIEFFVNEAVSYYVLRTSIWEDDKELKKMPDEIKLRLSKNRGYVDVFVDGKLSEEKRVIR